MIQLYWTPRTRSSRVVWMLEELGVDYERVHVDLSSDEAKANAEFRAASPMGKVPAIVDGEVRMADSAAIAIYLADRYASGTLAPAPDHQDRGAYLYWMIYSPGVIEPAMAEKITGTEPRPSSFGWGSFDLMVQTLAQAVADREWLLGDFSAADVMVGSSAAYLKLFGMLPDDSGLDAYIERCMARPAYQKALALDAESDG
ncbi:MAG: glutathione S-transferase [Pseudomonadota bacterium]